jgi:hypothetical protein
MGIFASTCWRRSAISTDIDDVQMLVTSSISNQEVTSMVNKPRAVQYPPLLGDAQNTFKPAADPNVPHPSDEDTGTLILASQPEDS